MFYFCKFLLVSVFLCLSACNSDKGEKSREDADGGKKNASHGFTKCVFRNDFCTKTVKTIVEGKATEFGPSVNKVHDANGEFNEMLDQWCHENNGKIVVRDEDFDPSYKGRTDGTYEVDGTSLNDLCRNAGIENCLVAEKRMTSDDKDTLVKNTARFCKLAQ